MREQNPALQISVVLTQFGAAGLIRRSIHFRHRKRYHLASLSIPRRLIPWLSRTGGVTDFGQSLPPGDGTQPGSQASFGLALQRCH